MSRLLAEKGIFFCGHAERQTAIEWGFEAVNESGVFACRKRCRENTLKDPLLEKPKKEIKWQSPEKKPQPVGKPLMPVHFPTVKSVESEKPSRPVTIAAKTEKTVNLFLEARAKADQGQLPKALELCEMFLGENPVHAEAHFLMGVIYEALHNGEKAEAFFNRAVYLNPEHVEALNHMAFIELERGNENGAERFWQRARRIREGMTRPGLRETGISGKQNGK